MTLPTAVFSTRSALNRKPWGFGHGRRNLFSNLRGGQVRANNFKPFENEKDLSHLERNLCRLGTDLSGLRSAQPGSLGLWSARGRAVPKVQRDLSSSVGDRVCSPSRRLALDSLKLWGHPTITTAVATVPACLTLPGCVGGGGVLWTAGLEGHRPWTRTGKDRGPKPPRGTRANSHRDRRREHAGGAGHALGASTSQPPVSGWKSSSGPCGGADPKVVSLPSTCQSRARVSKPVHVIRTGWGPECGAFSPTHLSPAACQDPGP